MTGEKKVRVETFALAGDDIAIWKLKGRNPWMARWDNALPDDPWLSGNVPSGPDAMFEEVRRCLRHLHAEPVVIHGTSWRETDVAVIHTHAAIVRVPGEYVLDEWPDAKPVTPPLLDKIGKPLPHAATEPPDVRLPNVLQHLLRHLAFLGRYDATIRAALDRHWTAHLAKMEPQLAGLYEQVA